MSRVEARGAQYEGQNAIVKARITTDAGTQVTSDGLSSTVQATAVAVKVYDMGTSPATLLNATTALAVGTAFVTAATGYLTTGWDLDSDGYNFCAVIPDGDGLAFNVPWEGAHTYRIEIAVSTGATVSPGSQAEGDISFAVELKVHSMYGTT